MLNVDKRRATRSTTATQHQGAYGQRSEGGEDKNEKRERRLLLEGQERDLISGDKANYGGGEAHNC